MSTPPWDIFKRIEDLEDFYLNLDERTQETEPMLDKLVNTVKDIRGLATVTLLGLFGIYISNYPDDAIRYKNVLIKNMRSFKTSERFVRLLDDILKRMYEAHETEIQRKAHQSRD